MIISSKANENKMKSFEWSWLTSIREDMIASLIFLKFFLLSWSCLNWQSFFNKLNKGFTISEKFEINLLIKFILPKNDCMAFLFFGRGIFFMAPTLAGSTWIPSFEIMWPNNFPWSTPKIDFLGFNEISYLRHLLKTCLRWSTWEALFFENTIRSSWYILIRLPIKSLNAKSIAFWKVDPTLSNPKGIFVNFSLTQHPTVNSK